MTDDTLTIGSALAHFRVVAKLGEGGMGVVWKAEDVGLQRPVALKVLGAGVLARPDMRARFLREARTAASLNHPGICTIYEVGEVDQVPFIAMELIEGDSLETRLRQPGTLGLSELVRIAGQVAEGLAAAHARGIVHRDLKPGNVMLTPDGQAKILDFGLAKPHALEAAVEPGTSEAITAEMTREGTILGTVSYMSPEQAEGKPVDPRSDVFSFGILLYEMAAGRLPFQGDTATSTLAKILETEPEPLSAARAGLPPDLERIVRRCLQKRPDDRYNDTRDLVAELRELRVTGEATAAVPRLRRGRLGAGAWIAAAATVVVLGAWLGRSLWHGSAGSAASAPAAVAAKPSVAVLPFHNLSAEPETDYFSAGITEEIISKLSRLDGLEVASRSSVAGYTDPARDVQRIGAELGVRYLLDGSVRRSGDRVRVSAQLVDGASGRNLWSEDFDGSLEDVFAIQEQTALKIAERLDLQLSPEERRGVGRRLTDNVAAYDAYLRGMAVSRDWGDRARLEAAIGHFEQALALDPDFAAALAGLAFVESDMYRNFDSSEPRMQRAEAYAERAVALDPTIPEASHALAQVAGNRFDYRRAAELLRETVRLAPKESRFWDNLSWALAYQTPPDPDGAIEAARRALQLQPRYPGAYYHLGRALLAKGDTGQARVAFERALEQDPGFGTGHLGLAQYHLAVGDPVGARAELDRGGSKATAIMAFYSAAIHAVAGEPDAALSDLGSSLEQGYRDFAGLEASPYFASLRSDPRYRSLLERYRD